MRHQPPPVPHPRDRRLQRVRAQVRSLNAKVLECTGCARRKAALRKFFSSTPE